MSVFLKPVHLEVIFMTLWHNNHVNLCFSLQELQNCDSLGDILGQHCTNFWDLL